MNNTDIQPSFSLNLSLSIWEKVPRVFTAEASHGGHKGFGSGSSANVAEARAVQNLMKVVEEEEGLDTATPTTAPAPTPTTSNTPTRLLVMAGRMMGHTFTPISIKAEFSDGFKLYDGTYDDGSRGSEDSRYLRELANPSSGRP